MLTCTTLPHSCLGRLACIFPHNPKYNAPVGPCLARAIFLHLLYATGCRSSRQACQVALHTMRPCEMEHLRSVLRICAFEPARLLLPHGTFWLEEDAGQHDCAFY